MLAVADEFGGAHINVIAGAAPHVFRAKAGAVIAPVMHEARFLKPRIKIRVALGNFLEHRDLLLGFDLVGHRGNQHVRRIDINASRHRLFRIDRPEIKLHQRIGSRHMGGRALDHRDIGARFPQGRADIMGGIVGADDHAFFAGISVGAGMLA